MRWLAVLGCVLLGALCLPLSAGARVLRVGTYHGIRGQYSSIEAAVDAAKANDWILIGPGDYKTTTSGETVSGAGTSFPTAILITKPGIYLRGMNRNAVIVDGTKSGPPCSKSKRDQNFGPNTKKGPAGLNGIMVWKANNVWVQNLTACNFLNGSDAAGNEIWWNGGANSGTATKVSIGGHGYYGSYLTTTSTFFMNQGGAAAYGIFSSNWSGGTWDHSYASNFSDSGYYIGACSSRCDQTVNHAWAEFNALGYSGSNSGGHLVIENSVWDNNETGFSTNSQEGDNPPPQDGACPHHGVSPITHTHSCWVLIHNYIHDNNNPNIPGIGLAAGGPVGTGVSLAGSRNDTLINNRIVRNNAWGISITPFPGGGPPCTGGMGGPGGQPACLWDSWGVAVAKNKFSDNGDYGNRTNGDIGLTNFFANEPTDCFFGNKDTSGKLTSAPTNVQTMYPVCKGNMVMPSDTTPTGLMFTEEVACDATLPLPLVGKAPCAPGDHYPRRTRVVMHPLPPRRLLRTMPNPCKGVPANPWCPGKDSKPHAFPSHRPRERHQPPTGFTG